MHCMKLALTINVVVLHAHTIAGQTPMRKRKDEGKKVKKTIDRSIVRLGCMPQLDTISFCVKEEAEATRTSIKKHGQGYREQSVFKGSACCDERLKKHTHRKQCVNL